MFETKPTLYPGQPSTLTYINVQFPISSNFSTLTFSIHLALRKRNKATSVQFANQFANNSSSRSKLLKG